MPTQPPRVIFVDVDDTLVRSFGSKRILMTPMVDRIVALRRAGALLYCWSSGGAAYAETSARELGIHDCFVTFLPKPHVLIDEVSITSWKQADPAPPQRVPVGVDRDDPRRLLNSVSHSCC